MLGIGVWLVCTAAWGGVAESRPVDEWKDDFSDPRLSAWEQVDMVLPDVMPYYPRRPVNRARWRAANGLLEVESQANAWSYLLRGQPTDRDYTLEFEMLVPFFTPDRVEYFGPYFASYRPGEFEPCWETAAVVRYVDRFHFYRVQFGWLGGGTADGPGPAVALWSPEGGFLQVVGYTPKAFVFQPVRVVAAGPTIEVWIDGQLKIHYEDTVAPILAGRAGLAVAGQQFYRFRNVRLSRNRQVLPAAQAVRPGQGTPHFHVRHFLRQLFLFDGNEPVGRFDRNSSMWHEVRLRPGYRPLVYFGLHWDQYNKREHFVDVPEEWVIEQSDGPAFVVRYRYRTPKGNVVCRGRLTVTRDAPRQSYLWDVDTAVEVAAGHTWLNEHMGLSFADPLPYDIVPHAVDLPDPWRCPYQWIVFHGPDGRLWRHPIFHNHVPKAEDQMRLKSDGGWAVVMHHPLANPALEFDFSPEPNLRPGFWLCPWAYDIHFLINPYEHGYAIPGGTRHRVRFRYWAVHGPEADRLMAASQVHPYFRTLPPRVLFTAGVNRFDKTTTCDVPHREYFWVGGEHDRKVGHGDACSMRLTNDDPQKPKTIQVGVGGSLFMGRFDSRRYRLTAWVRTERVAGPGAALFAQNGDVKEYSRRLTGSADWQPVELQTEILYGVLMASVGLELAGTGTVWLDDFQLEPLGR